MAGNIKGLKNGKISVRFPPKAREAILKFIGWRIETGTDELRTEILREILMKFQQTESRIKFTKIEFMCLFEQSEIEAMPDPVQVLIFSTINPKAQPIVLR